MDRYHNEKHVITASLSLKLTENIELFENIMQDCDDIITGRFTVGKANKTDIYLAYTDNMIDRMILQRDLIGNFIYHMDDLPVFNQFEYLKKRALQSADVKELLTMDEITQAAISGDVIILVDGYDKALMISLKSFPNRGIPTVETEVTVRGSKDSFTEISAFNKVLIRRRIKDTNLKMVNMTVGIRSRTSVTLSYIEGIADPGIIGEVKKRLDSFTIDGIFDIGMLENLIETKWYSLFPQFQSTERPDKTASALLEGRIVLLVDNSPMALILPVTLNSFFQAADDYYNRWPVASFIRVLRYIAAFFAMSFPGLYVVVTNYQPELLPTSLALSFTAARQGVPFSILVEVIILLLAFELLMEAGVRLPSPMGNTIGIVGGLIIGDAAVSANLASPMVVIVVACTAIASFTIPNETFLSAFRIVKYLILILSSVLGLYGFILGLMLVLIHLADLKSFGIPYLSPFVATNLEKDHPLSDSILKFPIFKMIYRPIYSTKENKRRLSRDKSNRFTED